ncbi:MAG: DJ-1/PfpI family protein [Clostridiales Family XIII bacterium]|jgi:4-methyl-5(b-hydroxyethyl)-thiazole monophosphate biosynthesis|nr:DJ-1/PfpI family protein [Clostridiales Family XIII bacterium]
MIFVHLAEGFEEIEALTVVDLLRRVGLDVKTVSISGSRKVMAVHGVSVDADLLFEEANYDLCEMIVLPGGLPGADHLAAHQGLETKLREFIENNRKVAAICASPARVLGSKGLLAGRKATAYPGNEDRLIGAEVGTEDVVIDGNIITSKGPATAMAFGLALVETLCGQDVRARLASDLLYQ